MPLLDFLMDLFIVRSSSESCSSSLMFFPNLRLNMNEPCYIIKHLIVFFYNKAYRLSYEIDYWVINRLVVTILSIYLTNFV